MMGHAGILPDAKRYSDEVETILLEARRLSRSIRMGEHGRRSAGAGSDFWQFRKFENGLDSPRLINWKQSAKSDGLFVRETEWSAPQTLSIMVDRSADNFIDHPKSKAYVNALIALTLGYVYSDASEKVRIDCGEFLQMDRPRDHAEIAETLMRPHNQAWQLPSANNIPQNSKALLLSSFFNDVEKLSEYIPQYAERGVTGCLLQVLTKDEITFPFSGRVKFENATGSTVFQSDQARALRAEYLEKLQQNNEWLQSIVAVCGWTFLTVSIEQDPRDILGLCIEQLGMR
jgi:uncharacterized protein (DUF58 family)